jgi:hypothetical protein
LVLRVYQAPQAFEISDTVAYQGCKSWVRLDTALPTAGSAPVLSDERFANLQRQLDLLLRPTATA